MGKVRVAVLRGGPSSEYDVSLQSGRTVLSLLPSDTYDVRDILVDKEGKWHLFGLPKEPADILPHTDVAFLAFHGEYGEDGKVQRLLDAFGVPYTGSGAYASALAMNKAYAKDVLQKQGVHVARHRILTVSPNLREDIASVMRDLAFPLIVKPAACGSSVGVTFARDQDMLIEGVRRAFQYSPRVMVEEYIHGREATCGVIDEFRGESLYSLLPIEIIPDHTEGIFDYEAKYSGKSKEICPGNFTKEESDEIQRLARLAHEKLGLSHYSRSDFIVSPKGIYYLETNTLPGLTAESLFPKAIAAVGSSLPEFFDHIITLARR